MGKFPYILKYGHLFYQKFVIFCCNFVGIIVRIFKVWSVFVTDNSYEKLYGLKTKKNSAKPSILTKDNDKLYIKKYFVKSNSIFLYHKIFVRKIRQLTINKWLMWTIKLLTSTSFKD